MRRSLLLGCALAAVVSTSVQGTVAGYSQSRANSATLSTQAVLPPVNTAVPTITTAGGGALTSVPTVPGTVIQGRVGSWAAVHAPAFTVTWQRLSGGTWTDSGSPLTAVDLGGGVIGALFTIGVGDPGTPLRIKVVATDALAAPTSATTAFSAQVGS